MPTTSAPTWFITGVSGGLGYEIAMKALEVGMRVIGTVRSRQKAAGQVDSIEAKGGKVLELDVMDVKACFEVWREAEKCWGRIDVLCNNAGMAWMGALEDYEEEEVRMQFEVNFFGPYRLIRAALPGFRERKAGTIVNISSVSGIDGSVAGGLYAASKFAIEGLSEALAAELAVHNIDVLLVEPGAFRTNFLGGYQLNSQKHLDQYPTAQKTLEIFKAFNGKQPGDPAKAADIIVQVASGRGASGHLKGQTLRLPLGPDCVAKLEKKIQTIQTEVEKVRKIAVTTNHV